MKESNERFKNMLVEKILEWERCPELQCNYCGAIFKGEHECDYESLKQQNKHYRELLNRIHDTDDIVEVYDIVDEYKALEEKLNNE